MFKALLQQAMIAAIQAALCQFLGFCQDSEDCPDGVCDDAALAIDELGNDAPVPRVAPGVTQAPADWNWDAIGDVMEAVKNLVSALRCLIGKECNDDNVVGG